MAMPNGKVRGEMQMRESEQRGGSGADDASNDDDERGNEDVRRDAVMMSGAGRRCVARLVRGPAPRPALGVG